MANEKLKKTAYKLMNGYSFMPFFLGLSISNDCNRKCNFCLYQSPDLKESPLLSWLDNQPNEMSYNKFADFIDNLGVMKYFIKSVGLTAKGEPMKHPDFFKFCGKLEDAEIKFSVTTNGDYIDKANLFILSGLIYLTVIRVSVYDIKTYNRLKGDPLIEFYNMTDTKIDGVVDGRKLWADGLTTNNVPKDFNRIDYCRKPFGYLTLNPDGSITNCNSWHEIGNAFEKRLSSLWNNRLSRDYKKGALEMNVPESDCANCAFN